MIPAVCPWGAEIIDDMFRVLGTPASNGWTENIFTRGGVSGDSSTAVKTRFLADTTRRNWNQIISAARGSFNATTIKADIAAMVAALPHTRYIVMGMVADGNQATEQGPAGSRYLEIVQLNADLAALYGTKFYNAHAFLTFRGQAAGNARSIANFVPSSVDQPTDIHLIAAAYNAMLVDLHDVMAQNGYLTQIAADEQTDMAGSRPTRRIAPNITSANTGSVQEGRMFSLTLTADKSNSQFSIIGGADAAQFTLEDQFGASNIYTRKFLKMRGKDFENPEDLNLDNQYVVIVKADDGYGNFTQQTITVTVTGTDDTIQFTETSAWIARMTFVPVDVVQGYIDRFVRKAVGNGYWANLSAFYLFANSDQQSARLNAKGATGTLTNNGALHIQYQGFRGDGLADYVEGIGLLALDATLNKNNVGAFVYSLTNLSDTGADIGFSNSSQWRMIGRNASGKNDAYPLSPTNKLVTVPDSLGLYGFQRFGTGGFEYVNHQAVDGSMGVASEFPTGNFRWLSGNGANFSQRIIAAAGITNQMTQAQWALLDTDLTELIGAIQAYIPAPVPAARFTCYFEGADGATAAVDEGGGKTMNFAGGAQLDTSQILDGTSSLRLTNPGDYVWMDDSPDWQLPLQFTIRARARLASFGASGHFSTIISHWDALTNQRGYQLNVSSAGAIRFNYSTTGSNSTTIASADGVIALNTNYEIQVDRDPSGKIRLYVADLDAVDQHANMLGSGTFVGDFFDSGSTLRIGDTDANSNLFNGWIDNTFVWKNETLTGSDAGYDPVVPAPPGAGKKMYEQTRFPNKPDFSPFGVHHWEMAYESEFFNVSDHSTPPVLSYIRDTVIPKLKARWPGLTYLAIDIESWPLGTGGTTVGSGASATFQPDATWTQYLNNHVNLITWFKTYWPALKVGYYGEVPVRDSLHLTGSATTNIQRTAVWKSRNSHIQPVVNLVDFMMPSVYSITDQMDDDLTAGDVQGLWARYARDAVSEGRRLDAAASPNPNTRLVIPAIWIEKKGPPEHTDTWNYAVSYEKLRICIDSIANGGADADGALWWSKASGSQPFYPAGTLASPPNASIYSSIDPGQWWAATKDFVDDFGLT